MAWLLASKLEMTRVVKWNDFIPVTLLKVPKMKIVAVKTIESDGYNALVLWILKDGKEWSLKDGKKTLSFNDFSQIKEFVLNENEISQYTVWNEIGMDSLEWVAQVQITWITKWKWFAWAMKRHNFSWWRATHGSKFHRALGSIWNRKPRRTHKGKKMHGHMWNVQLTIKKIPIEIMNKDMSVIGVRWPVPWARNSLVMLNF